MMKKFTSRKFWAMVAVLVTNVLLLLNVDSETITQVVALVMSGGAVIAYIFVQGKIDKDWFDENQSH